MTDRAKALVVEALMNFNTRCPRECAEPAAYDLLKKLAALSGSAGEAVPVACLGVPDRACNYLATCGEICNKCGRFHNPTGPLIDKLQEAEANYDRGFHAGQRIRAVVQRDGECVPSGYSSRMCERGTRSCIVEHADSPARADLEGWVMVPREATQKMYATWMCGEGPWHKRYAEMLAAAPRPAR